MKSGLRFFILGLIFIYSPYNSFASDQELLWEISDLPNPESVVFDSERNIVFVSNQNYGGVPGSASIGKLSLDGAVIEKEWVKGLNGPKGIAINGGSLFVSDIKELVEIDISTGKIINKFKGENANFLNDVVIDTDGQVYVSDMFNSSIYKLDKERKFKLWLESPELENPNGLLIKGKNLLISAWGRFSNGKPLTAALGSLIQVSLADKKVIKLSKKSIGNLDGIQNYVTHELIISDWVSGSIYTLNKKYEASKILSLEQSAGDIAFIAQKNLLLVPMAKQGKVLAYILKK